MAILPKEKPVLVAVYVEKPSRRGLFPGSNQARRNHHHHHLHHHLYLHRAKQHGPKGKGYNRRAELLEYSRNLRDSARSTSSTPLLNHSSPKSHSNQRAQKQIFHVKNKPKMVRLQTCLGDWKLLIPSFFRSSNMSTNKKVKKGRKRIEFQTAGNKIKTIMKSFQVNKNKGFISKVFASLKKHR